MKSRHRIESWRRLGLGGAAMVVLALLVAAEAGAQTLTISPGSGTYATTQAFDLALVLTGTGAAITGGSATFDGVDVTGPLVACVLPGTLVSGGRTFRCPGLTGAFLGTGTHTLVVTVLLANQPSVTQTVTWRVLAVTGP